MQRLTSGAINLVVEKQLCQETNTRAFRQYMLGFRFFFSKPNFKLDHVYCDININIYNIK